MSKSRDIADSAATINYIDTVTSNVQDQIDNIDPLPSQTGNNGLFLTTDGSTASWGAAGVTTQTVDVNGSSSITFTNIPAGIKQIFVGFDDVRVNTTTYLNFQLGSSSGIVTSGYQSMAHRIRTNAINYSSTTSSFRFHEMFVNITSGTSFIQLVDESNHGWAMSADLASRGSNERGFSAGSVTLNNELNQLKIYPSSGQFAEGTITIQYQ